MEARPTLPALSEHRGLRYAAFALLYAAQGLPYGLLSVAVPAYLAARGLSPAVIGGYLGVVILPWTFKLLDGPLMDRWTLLAMGRRRPWVIAAQLGMVAASLALAAVPDPAAHLVLLTALGFAVNFFAAFQDVAVDGMAIEIIPEPEQARANGLMWGGKMLGIAGAAAGGAWMLNAFGFGPTLVAHGGLVGAVMLVPVLLRERPGERLLPWTPGAPSPEAVALQLEGWGGIGRSLLRALRLPTSLVLLGIAFALGLMHGFFDATMPVFTVQGLGWADTGYAQLAATARIVSGVLGMALGGLLVERLGRRPTLAAMFVVVVVGALVLGLAPVLWPSRTAVQAFVLVYQLAYVFVSIAFFAVAMAACWKRVGATQFAIFMATSNLGLSAGSALLGPLSGPFGFTGMLVAMAAAAAVAAALVGLLDLPRHATHLDGLDPAEAPADLPAMAL